MPIGPVLIKTIKSPFYKYFLKLYLYKNKPNINASAHLCIKTAIITSNKGPHSLIIPIARDSKKAWIIIAIINIK